MTTTSSLKFTKIFLVPNIVFKFIILIFLVIPFAILLPLHNLHPIFYIVLALQLK